MNRAALTALVLLLTGSVGAQTLDSSAPGRLRISAGSYELDLSKTNGAVLDLRDPVAGVSLSLRSRGGCLWGTNYNPQTGSYKGGCSFSSSWPDRFEYQWDAIQNVLVLSYVSPPASTQRVDATVTIAFTPDHFDMSIAVTNRTGTILSDVLFPSDLVLDNSSIEAAYVPYFLPGVRLRKAYFTNPRDVTFVYPGAGSFADFRAFDIGPTNLSWYTVNPSGRIAPVVWGLRNDAATQAGTSYLFHNFQTWTPNGWTYQSPVVRFRVGATAASAILHYRAENGISGYPSITDKLGSSFAAVSRAPLVKIDVNWLVNPSFAKMTSQLDLLRSPALLHPVAYWPVGFDRNYPDFLPPDPRYGTIQDFAAFTRAAQSNGMFVMPYTNPTWWDPQSPTVKSGGVAAFSALDARGSSIVESYGVNSGFAVSPDAPATLKRLDTLMRQWIDDVPVDFVLNDQIGARPWLRDFNPAAPDPQHYSDAWLQFTRTYRSQKLMTEDGWDRLAETEVGFFGSALTGTTAYDPVRVPWGRGSRANNQFGPGLWEPYPLATYLFHDKVLLYHHDLDHLPMDAGAEVLTWNALFGVMAGYHWPEGYTVVNPDWLAIASAFQPSVLARTAGKELLSYEELAPDVYESRFDGLTTVANWMPDRTYDVDGYAISPSGFLSRSPGGSLVAGIFSSRFNGKALSEGAHYLIVENTGSLVTVRQPSGPDTSLTIDLPSFWIRSAGIQARAVGSDGRTIGSVPVTVGSGRAEFTYLGTVSGVHVDRYEFNPVATSPIAVFSVKTAFGGPEIAQNTWIEIYGTGLAPDGVPSAGITWSDAPEFAAGKMPVQLHGVSVTVNGRPAFISYVSKTQVNVLTPLDDTVGAVEVVVTHGANASQPVTVPLRAVAPSLPLLGATRYVVATHANWTLVGPESLYPGASTPARPGETIVLFAFGFGLPATPLVNGSATQSGMLPLQPVVRIGALPADVAFAGLIRPGLYQFNVVIPTAAAAGDNSISVTYGGAATPAGALITVGR